MTTHIVAVPFHSDVLTAIETNNIVYIAMRPIVENLGLSWASQTVKLRKSQEKFGCFDIETPSNGGVQLMLCIPLRKLNGWLFSINPNKVREDIRPRLIAYQEECFQVLHDYFTTGQAVRTTSKPTTAEEDAYYISLINEHFEMIIRACFSGDPALSGVRVLRDRFTECDALICKMHSRLKRRLEPGQTPRIF